MQKQTEKSQNQDKFNPASVQGTSNRLTFGQFRKYCLQILKSLTDLQNYEATYRTTKHPFLIEHDSEYLQFYRLKLHFLYSLAYQIPVLYFSVSRAEDGKPLLLKEVWKQVMNTEMKELDPQKEDTGIFGVRHPITGQFCYGLHNCELNMPIERLVPWYFSLFGLHPGLL